MEKKFQIMGVQQIAIGSLSKEKIKKLWVDILGLKKIGFYENEKENVREDIIQLGTKDNFVELDLMEPIDETKKPSVYKPALNHIGLWVDNIENCVDYLQKNGVRIADGGIRMGASGHKVCFIHPKGNEDFPISGEGVLIELVQHPINN